MLDIFSFDSKTEIWWDVQVSYWEVDCAAMVWRFSPPRTQWIWIS